jgi:nucleoside-diphosphate-sugar epimerase
VRVLITGITGMAGSHLAEYLLERGDHEVFGTMRWRSRLDNLDDMDAMGQLNTMEGMNISDAASLERHARRGAANIV